MINNRSETKSDHLMGDKKAKSKVLLNSKDSVDEHVDVLHNEKISNQNAQSEMSQDSKEKSFGSTKAILGQSFKVPLIKDEMVSSTSKMKPLGIDLSKPA